LHIIRVSADEESMTADDLIDRELMLSRFRRLIFELLRGTIRRTVFGQWEVEILLDIESQSLDPRRRMVVLRKYERAVMRQLESGPGPPMTLSEHLQRSKRTRLPSNE
jgi:hypothetical protein